MVFGAGEQRNVAAPKQKKTNYRDRIIFKRGGQSSEEK